MPPAPGRPRRFPGPALAFAVAWLALCTTTVWLVRNDRLDAVATLGIPTMQPRFVDVRVITGAAVALAEGLDPLQENPGDPLHRPLNYPRVWLLPARLGLGPDDSEALALTFLALFAAGVLSLTRLATSWPRALVLTALSWSPVTWLAMERANTDLVVFASLAAAAALWRRRPAWATAVVGLGTVLKLYPVFAATALLGVPRRAARRLGGALLFGVAVYGATIWRDLSAIRANSAVWNRISYGITQLPDAVAPTPGLPRLPLLVGAASLLVAAAAAASQARRHVHLPAAPTPALHAFRSGAAVVVGTFCIGSNFDYRLLALLLVAPQVVAWCGAARGIARLASGVLLGAITLLTWSLWWRRGVDALCGATTPGLVLDELLTWLVVLLLLAGLVVAQDRAKATGAAIAPHRVQEPRRP